MMKLKPQIKWFILAVLILTLAACNGNTTSVDLSLAPTYAAQTLAAMPTNTMEPVPTSTATVVVPTATATATETPVTELYPVGPVGFPENVNPLTGLVVDDPSILDRRPVLIKGCESADFR